MLLCEAMDGQMARGQVMEVCNDRQRERNRYRDGGRERRTLRACDSSARDRPCSQCVFSRSATNECEERERDAVWIFDVCVCLSEL